MYIIFDTETTGLPKNWTLSYKHTDNWPRCVQIAWQLHDKKGGLIEAKSFIVRPDDFDIPFQAEQVHGISTLLAKKKGHPLESVLAEFNKDLNRSEFVVGHNINFDINVMGAEFVRKNLNTSLHQLPILDTCTEETASLCRLPGGRGGKFKLPTLSELHNFLFDNSFEEAHNATADVQATARSFFELIRKRIFTAQDLKTNETYFDEFLSVNPDVIQRADIGKHINLKEESQKLKAQSDKKSDAPKPPVASAKLLLKGTPFAHLHNHTQFSVLQSSMSVQELVNKAIEYEMPAVAITDLGSMMGAFHFEKAVSKYNKKIKSERLEAEAKNLSFDKKEIIPIIGCEFYVCEDHANKSYRDDGYQIVFLAKNKNGYHNLSKMASIAFTEGKYYVPRIDKKIVEKYKEDLLVLSGNLYGEIPHKILNIGENQAEEALLWWKEQFKDDFYLEIMRHNQEDEQRVNEVLLNFSKKHDIKIVATNNTFYTNKKDSEIQDILLCIKDGETVNTPKGRGRGFRFGLPNDNYYFKTADEMKSLFTDLPEAILNSIEIVEKCEKYTLSGDVLLPKFEIPEEFRDTQDLIDGGKRGENNYLKHLTYKGAEKRYPEITDEIIHRLDFELETIEKTGYPGYFLIVQDFCKAAREMGVIVGPGRGSAAGSAVAYCTGITNIDPIEYNLLFERFLNPDRVSMPDIDIDFDDEGRSKILNWVIEKYGANQVAQIITYGTMAAKSSIRDTARALNLHLSDANRLSKLVPPVLNITLKDILNSTPEILSKLLKNNPDNISLAEQLISISKGNDLQANVLKIAQKIEGNIRNTGIHACGVIITPDDITEYVPVALAKDSEMFCTQYDNSVVEEAGLLKMDFLGLKTLTLIKDAVQLIKERHQIDLNPDDFPIDDEKTYQLFQRGETVGIFQYESIGMQKYMRQLKPTTFADLIAMNALYRPGPIEYIPDFIERKNGQQKIVYDIEDSKEYLEETYGITVYQEQVMLLSQKLGGFTRGEADTLRKAMGKKQHSLLGELKPKFINQGMERGHDKIKLEKIWNDWEAFASYAFNKSHSTCYAWVAYQTAYLKANYPAEFMASVLSNNMNDIKQVSFFMNECKRMGLDVLGPDINESGFKFTVNKKGAIRFGLGAIKGVGAAPVEAIITAREEGELFHNIFDVTKRVNLRKCNKKAFDGLVLSGAMDSFSNMNRAQYFVEDNNSNFLMNTIKFGLNYQENANSNQFSLFDGSSGVEIPTPKIPAVEDWSTLYKLKKEKEVVGLYISGHPLDDYKVDIESFCKGEVSYLNDLDKYKNQELTLACFVSETEHRFTKKGTPFGILGVEDYNDSARIFLFNEDYGRYKHFMVDGTFIYIVGRVQQKNKQYATKTIEYEFKIKQIDYLSKIREQKAKALEIKIPLQSINKRLIDDLYTLFQETSGNYSVKFNVTDNKRRINLSSRKARVAINEEMFKGLDKIGVQYKLV